MDIRVLFETVPEDDKPMNAKVTGTIPDWVKGTFLRVGPGKYELGSFKMNYWIDGMSLLGAFHIDGNKVTYQRQYLKSDALKKGVKAEKPMYTEFGTRSYADPSKGVLSRMINSLVPGDLTDNCNLNAFIFNGDTVAATETCFCRIIDPRTLETKDKIDLTKTAKINVATCHPHIAPDGTLYNIGCNFYSGLKYTVYKTPPGSKNGPNVFDDTTILCTFSPSWKTSYGYFHSFGFTDKYLILVELPYTVNSLKLIASKVQGKSFKECLEWNPDDKAKFILINRATGERAKTTYLAPSFFFLHHINAYEDQDQLVIDLVSFGTPAVFDSFLLEYGRAPNFKNKETALPKRYVLPLPSLVEKGATGTNLITLKNTKATAEKQKDGSVLCIPDDLFEAGAQGGFDVPKINYKRCNGRPYRYVYGTGFFEAGITKNSLAKGDVTTRQLTIWSAGEDFYCGEPTLIESPDAKEEDDGIIVAGVCSAKPDRDDYMVVLDAKTFKEIGRASVPARITPSTHGIFVPK